jgi:hypothetical protein
MEVRLFRADVEMITLASPFLLAGQNSCEADFTDAMVTAVSALSGNTLAVISTAKSRGSRDI